MECLIIERTDKSPLLEMDWMKKFKLPIGRIQLVESNQSEHGKVFNRFPIFFKTTNNKRYLDKHPTEIKTIKQKARPVPLHLLEDDGRELEKLIKYGNLETINDGDEDCFVSPVLIIVKSDKSVKKSIRLTKSN